MRAILHRLGLAQIHELDALRDLNGMLFRQSVALQCENDALRAENANLKRAGVDRLAEELNEYRAARSEYET